MTPDKECSLCERLVEFRKQNREKYPDFFNAPVPSFGDISAELLIVGLAPGLKGANRTGRPFTGDYAGDLLYPTLKAFGLAKGTYKADPDDGFTLINSRITNAVRCVPPQNKVNGAETKTCNSFLQSEIAAMENLKVIITLGTVAHGAVITAFQEKKSAYKFAHSAEHKIGETIIINSYHCSRYNTNTGRLTEQMFKEVFAKACRYL